MADEDEIKDRSVWTIGHSTHSIEELATMLHSFKIGAVVDIRRFPGSKKFPQFNKDALGISLPEHGILYFHLMALGGRRKPGPASKNSSWRSPAFRGYADYMETGAFKEGIQDLEKIALTHRTACMCSEAVWWRCHRALVADYLKARGWKVMHIMGAGKAEEHPYTAPAKIIKGRLSYEE